MHFIDPRVDHVGVSKLRQLDARSLKEGTDNKTLVIRERDEPLAVLLSYEQYLVMQNQLQAFMETVEILTNKKELAYLAASLKESNAGQAESLEDIRRSLKDEHRTKKKA